MTTTRETEVAQNLELARHYLLWLLDHPDKLAGIPDGAVIGLREGPGPRLTELSEPGWFRESTSTQWYHLIAVPRS